MCPLYCSSLPVSEVDRIYMVLDYVMSELSLAQLIFLLSSFAFTVHT